MDIKGTILSRMGWIYVLFLIVALSVLGKIMYLQIAQREKWKAKAEEMSERTRVIPATRGNILDTYGNPISSTVPAFDLAIDPLSTGMDPKVFEEELPGLAKGLAEMFGDKTAWEYQAKIRTERKKKNRYVPLRKDLSYAQAKQVEELPLFRHGRYRGGLILDQKNIRLRPYNVLAKRTIGYVQDDGQPAYIGLEGKFDSFLKGQDGLRHEYRLSGNNWIPASSENIQEPRDGLDIVTTLDMNYQDVASDALLESLLELDAEYGCAVLMEVATGEIKAMVNLGLNRDSLYDEIYNYAVGDRQEPGSTFKLPSLIAALETGKIDMDDTINTFTGEYNYYGEKIRDSHSGGYGIITVKQVLEKSSNIGMARIAEKCFRDDEEDFIERLYSMGLKEVTGIEIEGEPQPNIKYPQDSNWYKTSLGFIAHGYEIALTPIQILTFYNAVANKGKMVAPRLVKEIYYYSHHKKTLGPRIIKNSICSKETLEKARTALEGVVTVGTATNLNPEGYQIAGKTGTAVIYRNGGYEDEFGNKYYRASFVGYFPADKPKYSCIVVVSNPHGRVYGNTVAGSVFQTIADKVYATDISLHPDIGKYSFTLSGSTPALSAGTIESGIKILNRFGVQFSENTDGNEFASIEIAGGQAHFFKREIEEDLIPDVTGMSLTDALPLLENRGLKVSSTGYGKIVSQSVNPGERFRTGQYVQLKLDMN